MIKCELTTAFMFELPSLATNAEGNIPKNCNTVALVARYFDRPFIIIRNFNSFNFLRYPYTISLYDIFILILKISPEKNLTTLDLEI